MKMCPNPLSKVFPDCEVRIGVEQVLLVDAEIATLAMRVIATCSYIDLEMTKLAARFAKSDFTIISGMLAPMRAARKEAITAAAEVALTDPEDLALYRSVVARVESIK